MSTLWNSTLETGVAKIDEQHKELFRQVDTLRDRSQANRIDDTLRFLAGYVVKHFRDEELLQMQSNYPKKDAHKKLHVQFISTFRDLKKQYEAAGNKLDTILNVNKVVIGWLKDHIMVHDKEFAQYYKKYSAKK
ncbi:hemerythrin [Deltaproteobacteria bacterium Smac51]|nr:hemerythrin [Deltaproteobacteria bacterium Smac51]